MPGLDVMGQLRTFAEVLRTAERLGAGEDAPEGVRYIQISETLADKMAALLDAVSRWNLTTGLPLVDSGGPSYAVPVRGREGSDKNETRAL